MLILIMAIGGVAFADTPPARSINSFTYDGTGTNAISSTLFGGKKALDINVANTEAQPAFFSTVVSGAVIDPRDIRTLTPADVVTAEQGGVWNIQNITGTIPLPTGAATEATLGSIDGKITTTVNGIKVDIGASVLSGAVDSRLQDGAGNDITSTDNGGKQSLDVNVTGSALPTGAATEITLGALNTKVVTTVDGIKVDGSAVTQPVSIATVPLPTGAATEATLSAINTKTPTLGQKAMVGSIPVVIASDQSAFATTNSNLDVLLSTRATEATLSTRATEATLSAINNKTRAFDLDSGAGAENVQGVNLRFAANGGSVQAGTSANPIRVDPIGITIQPVNGTVTANIGTTNGLALESTQSAMSAKLPATLGQKTSANSFPVVLASDQSGLAVSQSGTWNINNITGAISLPTGAATSTLQSTINTTLGTSLPRRLQDGAGNNVTSQANGGQRALDVGINIGGVQVDPRSIRALTSGGDSVTAVQGGVWNVGLTGAVPLPAGAATEAKQDTGNTTLSNINNKIRTFDGDTGAPAELMQGVLLRRSAPGGSVEAGTSINPLRVDVTGATTQPVSVSALPLPTGAATAAKQDTNTAAINAVTSQLDVLLSTRASESTLNTLNSKFSSLGQKTMGNSVPVVLSSDQSAIPISGTVTASIADVATEAKQDAQIVILSAIDSKLGSVDTDNVTVVSSALPTGAATSANQTSGNALLTTIDSSISSLSAKFNSLGQKVMAGSVPVVISSDQSDVPFRLKDVDGTGITSSLVSGRQAIDVNAVGVTTAQLEDLTVVDTISALNDTVNLAINGISGSKALVTGTWDGTIKFEVSLDGSVWHPAGSFSGTTGVSLSQTGITTNDVVVLVGIAGAMHIRARADSWTSGTATVLINASNGVSNVFANNLKADNFKVQLFGDDITQPVQVDGSGNLQVVQSGVWNIQDITGTIALPTGAATSANQTTVIGHVDGIEGLLTTIEANQLPDNHQVVVSSSALPTGAATSALQSTGNTSLDSIDTDIDVALSTRATEATVSAINAKLGSLGQKAMVGSAPVVIASDQTPIPASQSGTWAVTSPTASNFNAQVVGNVASGIADSGNPVKIGGTYNATQQVFGDGQRANAQMDSWGAIHTTGAWNYTTVSGATTTAKSSAGRLNTVCMNSQVNGLVITLYDNTTATGTVIATITPPNGTQPFCMNYGGILFTTGLTIVVNNASQVTATWK